MEAHGSTWKHKNRMKRSTSFRAQAFNQTQLNGHFILYLVHGDRPVIASCVTTPSAHQSVKRPPIYQARQRTIDDRQQQRGTYSRGVSEDTQRELMRWVFHARAFQTKSTRKKCHEVRWVKLSAQMKTLSLRSSGGMYSSDPVGLSGSPKLPDNGDTGLLLLPA